MTRMASALAVVGCSVVLGATGCAHTGTDGDAVFTPTVGQHGKDVIWVPTSQAMVDLMLDMAGLTPADYLVDLGSGDGRLVITAARRGATALGIEYDADMVALSRRLAEAEGVSGRASFAEADIFKSDFSSATIVTLFLLPNLNERLRPTLLNMRPGTRVVANSFRIGDWLPDETVTLKEGCWGHCLALKWVVPAKVGGTWKMDGKELRLVQKYQMLEGSLRDSAGSLAVVEARMNGPQIQFVAGGKRYVGHVDGDTMQGVVDGARWSATR
ncbi:MAG: methyltransferase domain-containing protein [Rhodocyclaceae bacterium]